MPLFFAACHTALISVQTAAGSEEMENTFIIHLGVWKKKKKPHVKSFHIRHSQSTYISRDIKSMNK